MGMVGSNLQENLDTRVCFEKILPFDNHYLNVCIPYDFLFALSSLLIL